MKMLIRFLVLMVVSSFTCYAQDSVSIHIDTLKFVSDSVQWSEGVNGKMRGPIARRLLKERYHTEAGYNKIFRQNGKVYFEGEYQLANSVLKRVGVFKFY